VIPSVTVSHPNSHVTVSDQNAELKSELKRHGITQDRLARAAGVSRTMVTHLLAGRTKSARIRTVAQRLIERAGRRKNGSNKTARAVQSTPTRA
jgi:predicted transcriptional regulator